MARAHDLSIIERTSPTGRLNAITDVPGIKVGQVSLHAPNDGLMTGVTAVLPGGDLFGQKRCAGLHVANGYGKFTGATQIHELGEIETPIAITNTLAAPTAASALIDWTLARQSAAKSVNPVVGEVNDSRLNDIRRRRVSEADVLQALEVAKGGMVEEGGVGAGSGSECYGWKGGVGTASRQVSFRGATTHLGVLTVTNLPGHLRLNGKTHVAPADRATDPVGSIIVVLAAEAPLDPLALQRLAARGAAGIAYTGSSFPNGSGDYVLAFSQPRDACVLVRPEELDGLFAAAANATAEAILNAIVAAHDVTTSVGILKAWPGDV